MKIRKLSDSKTWPLLTNEEKTVLLLSYGHERSSWEAGEVVGKAHYKYLEVLQRATFIMKEFEEFFSNYQGLFNPNIDLDESFMAYIRVAMSERLPIRGIINRLKDHPRLKKAYSRRKLLIENMERLRLSDDDWGLACHKLILDFDRYNSSRILPVDIQLQSGFKRRTKHREKRLIRLASSWPVESLQIFASKYKLPRKEVEKMTVAEIKNSVIYVPLLAAKEGLHAIATVHRDNLEKITALGLYAFLNKNEAMEFHTLCRNYLRNETKHCKEGQIFWPNYRRLINRSINHKEIEMIPMGNLRSEEQVHYVK